MRTIYKYGLTNWLTQLTLQDPKFLHVGLQNDIPQIWVETDPDAKQTRQYRIEAVGTGHNVPENGQYIGTVLMEKDCLVLHFYAVKV